MGLAEDFAARVRAAAAERVTTWPNPSYVGNAKGFCVDALGFEPWEEQQKILDALDRQNFVACRSGHRIGKTFIAGSAVLKWYGTIPGARGVLLAPSGPQIRDGVWRDTRRLFMQSQNRVTLGVPGAVALDGKLNKRFDTGLRADDGREVFGRAPENEGMLQGLAGALLIVVDEASLVDDPIFTVIDSNLAGGGKLLVIGNPNRSFGYFHRACTTNERFKGAMFHVPSTKSPNVVAGRIVIEHLATLEWVLARAKEWGIDSPEYKIRVLGEFVEAIEGRLFPPEMIMAAEKRHAGTLASGQLVIGVDPAGDSGDGDESAFAPRRGKKVTRLHTRRGLTPEGHVIEVLGLIKEEGSIGQPIVVLDVDGHVGWKVWRAFVSHLDEHPDDFRLIAMKGMRDERRQRKPDVYDSQRDELSHNLREALREGLAIPPDELKLVRELAEIKTAQSLKGRERITSKDDLRRALGRSPDRYDALALCAWVPSDSIEKLVTEQLQQQAAAAPSPRPAMDPYQRPDDDGDDVGMDPYAPAR